MSFECSACEFHTNKRGNWNRHLRSKKHQRGGKEIEYECKKCGFYTKTKGNWEAHLLTKKHTGERDKWVINKTTFTKAHREFRRLRVSWRFTLEEMCDEEMDR